MLMDMISRCSKRLIVLMAACCLILPWGISQALAYVPPLGIPDPGFGIDDVRPARPEPWSSEIPGYYYINQQTGTNTGRTYGTPSAPRQTFPSPIPAGSYVEVHGTYTSGNNIIITGKGTNDTWSAGSAGPVWIVGENISTRPNFTQRLVITGTYIYFDTVYFSTGYGSFQVGSATTGYAADHIVLRNSEAAGNNSVVRSNVSVVGASTTPVTNVVIYKNTLHGAGDIAANYDQDAHATTVGVNTSNVWFLENTIHTSSGSGAQVGGASAGYDTCHHVYYGKNHVYNTRAAGLAVKYASDIVFSQNSLHDLIDTRPLYDISKSPSKGVGYQYAPNRLWILYNTIYNASYGIYGGSTNTAPPEWHIWVIGNVIHDIAPPASITYNPENSWSEAGIMMAGGTYKYIVNNTIFNVVGGIYCPSTSSYQMENNVISNVTTNNGYHVFMDSGTGANASTLKNSIIHQSERDERIRWSSSYIGNLSYVQASTARVVNSLNLDPKFIDAVSRNLKVQPSSPAVEAGIDTDVYSTFYKMYGLSIQYDRDNISRPSGGGWDIGAYEFSDSIVPKIMNIILR